MSGLIHVYCGEGKGKTTSAMGLALRSVYSGKKVVIAQFLKNGLSSEILALKEKFDVNIITSDSLTKFTWEMDENELKTTIEQNNAIFVQSVISKADVLILDELCSVCNSNLIDVEIVENFIKTKPLDMEVVITGREPLDFMLDYADYITEMKKIKHPFDKGITARKGIEY